VHPYQPTFAAAAWVLAQRGERVAPLMIELLKDDVPGLRAGALGVLAQLYRHDGETFRTQVDDPRLTEVLAAVAPLIDDTSNDVRRAVIGLVNSVRVDNADTRRILRKIATTPDMGTQAGIQGLMRYQIQDPALRVDLARLSAETLIAMENPNPGSLKVLPICATAHLAMCEPLIPACVRLLDTHALTLWGMFSDSPTQAVMAIFEQFPADPRVRKALPSVLRFYTRKVGGKNGWWIHVQEGPRRILLRVGPAALPALGAFLASEREVFARYAAGEATPANAWKTLWPGAELRFEELADVAALIGALHGPTPAEEAVALMCRLYVERDWSEAERQMIRDRLAAMGPPAAPHIRRLLKTLPGEARGRITKRIAAWQAGDGEKLKALQREIKPLTEHLGRIDALAAELADMATLVELAGMGKAAPEEVAAACRLCTRRPWVPQRAILRNTLQKWGSAAAGPIRRFIPADRAYFDERMAALDAEEAHCRATQRFGRGLEGSLIRLDLARADVKDDYAALADLAAVIEAAGAPKLSKAAAADLCRIYTRRGWARQNEAIAAALPKAGAGVGGVIGEQIALAEAARAEATAAKLSYLSNSVKSRYKWRYDRARALEGNLTRGIAELKKIAGATR